MGLDYLPRAALFHEASLGSKGKSQQYDSSLKGRLIKSSGRQSFLSPIVRLVRDSAGVVGSTVLRVREGITDEQRATRRQLEEDKQILILRLKNAQSFDEWKKAASELDKLEDNDTWKLERDSNDFDAPLIETRLKQLDDARMSCDTTRMLYLVRTSLARDLGGISNAKLYNHSRIGTKKLIERYIDSTLDTIRALVATSALGLPVGVETKDILEQVVYARQAFGRSALLLSGGATFGMNHVGVLKALFDAQLLPRIISGASAGSIVCSVLCTRTDEEIPEVLRTFPYGDLAVFEEDGNEDGLLERIGRFLTQGAWIDMRHLIRVMQALLGDMTFQEAYNRTRRILNICVSSASIYELPRLLNYVTSPNIMIWSAVAASCSVPLLFSAAHLLVKNPMTGEHLPWNPTPQRWIDGSVDNDLPMTRLAEMFNVNHFIVSQVNPHVVPFLAKDDAPNMHGIQPTTSGKSGSDWLHTITNLAKGEAVHRMHVLADLGIFPNLVTKARSVLSQKYSGDITILPEIYYKDFPRILKNPTAEFMVQACLCGERAAWPKMSRIRNHCAVELELDSAVQQLRARVIFSPSQANLRRLGASHSLSTSPGTNGNRKRRVSGSNLLGLAERKGSEDDLDQDLEYKVKQESNRPLLHKARSNLGPSSGRISLAPFISVSASPQISIRANQSSNKPPENYELTSEAETTGDVEAGFASSDADIDSHTDSSSPEPEPPSSYIRLSLLPLQTDLSKSNYNDNATHDVARLIGPSPVSLFNQAPRQESTTSQPPTPGLDLGMSRSAYHNSLSLNATTPPSSIVETPAVPSPDLIMTPSLPRGRGRGITRDAVVSRDLKKDTPSTNGVATAIDLENDDAGPRERVTNAETSSILSGTISA